MSKERDSALQNLKTCRGQMDGIIRMLDEGRYCIDVSNQIMAAQALLKKSNKLILQGHMKHCMTDAIKNGNVEDKIKEISSILDKLL